MRMILAYCNLSDGIDIQLFDDKKVQKDSLSILEKEEGQYSRPDLLVGISEILQKNNLVPKDIHFIYAVTGPGRFTAVRTACLIANAFAKEQNTKLCPVSLQEFESAGKNFQKLISLCKCKSTDFVEPIFSGPPRINSK